MRPPAALPRSALRALAADPRAGDTAARRIASADAYLGNAAAFHLAAWKAEAAAALGWDARGIADAHLETPAALRSALLAA